MSEDLVPEEGKRHPLDVLIRIILVFVTLYIFLVGIKSLGHGLAFLGKQRLHSLIVATDNPFVGLLVGVLVTSIIQSSSTTTSIVVGLVGSGQMSVQNAVPIVMGANIGTSVTNTIVAMTSITRRDEFRKAMSAATMHDFFNILTVIVLLPLELIFGFLHHVAQFATYFLRGFWGATYHSPFQAMLKWGSKQFEKLVRVGVGAVGLPEMPWVGIVFAILSLIIIFFSLIVLITILKSLMMKHVENILDKYLGGTGIFALFIGFFVTGIIQSSSVTTSILVPVVAAGVISLEAAFPITLGANLGTTLTALMASLAANSIAGLTIALVHFFFNVVGILIFFPLPQMRQIPLGLARWMGDLSSRSRVAVVGYLLAVFFIIPTIGILLWRGRL